MRIHVTSSMLVFLIHLPGMCEPKQMPRDIRAFAEHAKACEHFGGEYDGRAPVDRKRQVERGIRKYCGAASRQLPKLRAKYRRDPAMLEMIDRLANEAVTDYRR